MSDNQCHRYTQGRGGCVVIPGSAMLFASSATATQHYQEYIIYSTSSRRMMTTLFFILNVALACRPKYWLVVFGLTQHPIGVLQVFGTRSNEPVVQSQGATKITDVHLMVHSQATLIFSS